jgi:hypothetical protein
MQIFRKSFSVVALVLSLILIFQIDAFATETRVGSMGGVGFYMRDNSNIFLFPGTFYKYSDQVVGELRIKQNQSFYTVGAHLPVSNTAQVGIYLNSPLSWEIPIEMGIDEVELSRTTDIFFGTQLENFDLGVALKIAMDSYNDQITDDLEEKQSASYFELAAGISNEKMDLGLIFGLPSANRDLDPEKRSWGGFGVGFNGRYWLGNKNFLFKFVPLIVANYASLSGELDPGIPGSTKSEVDYGLLDLAAGIGINYEIDENNLIVVGIEAIGYSSETRNVKDVEEESRTTLILPGIYMGVESHISSWLIGRLGAAQVYQKITEKYTPEGGNTDEESFFDKEFKMTFGLGIMFGRFLLDARINEGLLFEGPNFISGTFQEMAYTLSITYNFGKIEEKGDSK